MLKFISWNIDSLNAALTSDSPRAQLSRDVLHTLAGEDADTAGQKGLCRNDDPLQRRHSGGEDRPQDRRTEHHG